MKIIKWDGAECAACANRTEEDHVDICPECGTLLLPHGYTTRCDSCGNNTTEFTNICCLDDDYDITGRGHTEILCMACWKIEKSRNSSPFPEKT